MLSLAAMLVLVAAAPARADVTANEIDLAGTNGVALPSAAKSVLDLDQLLGLLSYQVRSDYTLVTVNLNVPGAPAINSLVSQLAGLAGVRFAERNALLQIQDAPNDPLLGQETELGQLGAPQAWGTTNGAGVSIGIVDTGVQLNHPDLAPALATSGTNLRARNGSNANDDEGHGTQVAGAAAARGGNGVGGAGIAWGSSIIPVKVTDATGSGTATDIADGIRYAVANGARIVNVSMAGDTYSQALTDAVDQANAQGVLIVAAAGNQARNIDPTAQPAYPASLPEENVLAVAATNAAGGLATDFSNYGPNSVDIAAPGVNILTPCTLGTSPNCASIGGAGYTLVSGTSIAAPLVSGMAALLAAVHPDWRASQLRSSLMSAAAACGPVSGVQSGLLCAPPEIRAALAGSSGGGGAGGAGAGAGATGGGGTGAKTASGASTSSVKLVLRRARAVRLGPGRTRIRWSVVGSRAGVKQILLRVDRRRAKRLSARATRLTVRGHAGTHRYAVIFEDAHGHRLGRIAGTFSILP